MYLDNMDTFFIYTDYIHIYVYIYQLKKEEKWIYVFARCL